MSNHNSTITGVAWFSSGMRDHGTIGIVTINNGFEDKAYIKYIQLATNVENDAIQVARYGGKFPLPQAQNLIQKIGDIVNINYKSR